MAAAALTPFRPRRGGLQVVVRLTPRAGADRIGRVEADARGEGVLKVTVTAPPEDGKANARLIELLAKAWRLPKSAFSLTAGGTSRQKTLHIAGDGNELKTRLETWLETRDADRNDH